MATSERTRPVVAVAIAVALVAALGGWWWSQRESGPRLGDYGEVTAEVGDSCMYLRISVDDLNLEGARPLPAELRGRDVEGTLELTRRRAGSRGPMVGGVFTSDAGVEVEVSGGRGADGHFFEAGCAFWPEPPPG